jgi:hypothetical protein
MQILLKQKGVRELLLIAVIHWHFDASSAAMAPIVDGMGAKR